MRRCRTQTMQQARGTEATAAWGVDVAGILPRSVRGPCTLPPPLTATPAAARCVHHTLASGWPFMQARAVSCLCLSPCNGLCAWGSTLLLTQTLLLLFSLSKRQLC